MDPSRNPFAPGAGTRPPELAGRETIISEATIALRRVKAGKSAKSQMMLGLRGVGKTVLLNQLAEIAETEGFLTLLLEAPEDRRLADMLVAPLRQILFRMSRVEGAKDRARRALAVLRSFTKAFKVKVGDVEFSVDAEQGTADSGTLDMDLPEVLVTVAEAAKQAKTGVALFIDEVQYLTQEDLAALIVALHKVSQRGLPFLCFGAGLPQLAGLAGDSKSYAERLFSYPEVGALSEADARAVLVEPIKREGEQITTDAVRMIIEQTRGYPYFLQEWGSSTWNTAVASPLDKRDVEKASQKVMADLDKGFFRVRLDRLTPREKDYVRAMAALGEGPHRSGEIAQQLGIDVTTAGPLRTGLIKKGMICSPQHGDTAFTVPMFDEFMIRSMPDWSPGAMTAPTSKQKSKHARTKR